MFNPLKTLQALEEEKPTRREEECPPVHYDGTIDKTDWVLIACTAWFLVYTLMEIFQR
jgi:hypothetical protein